MDREAGIGLTVMASVNETFQPEGAADLDAVVLARFANLTDLVADQGAAPTAQAVTDPRTGAG